MLSVIQKVLGDSITGSKAQAFLKSKLGTAGNNNDNNSGTDTNNGSGGGSGQKTGQGKYDWLNAEEEAYKNELQAEAQTEFDNLNSAIGRRQQYYADRSTLAELNWAGDWRKQPVRIFKGWQK